MMSPDSEPRVYSESRMYSDLLLCQGRGFPLYRPEPQKNLPDQYQRTGIAIGDVGTVTVEGDFDFFFNIYLEADNPINANVPQDFVPLLPYLSVDIKHYGFDPGNHVSTGIHKLSGFFQFHCRRGIYISMFGTERGCFGPTPWGTCGEAGKCGEHVMLRSETCRELVQVCQGDQRT
ncbi:hypothetical protein B0H14DRAFT_1339426 [Mycena olivaceomarginata]|nr:hypothetical protein B0H14DRAFT_1339426 [Mycena olivaceomarginata]